LFILVCLSCFKLSNRNEGGANGNLDYSDIETNSQIIGSKAKVSRGGFSSDNHSFKSSQNIEVLEDVNPRDESSSSVDKYFENVKTFQQIGQARELLAKHNPKGGGHLSEMLEKMTNIQAFVIDKMHSPNARLWQNIRRTSDGEYRDGSVAVDLKMRDSEMIPWNVDVRVEGMAFSVVYNRDGFVEKFNVKTIDGVLSWAAEFHPSGGVRSFVYSKFDKENNFLVDKALFILSEDGGTIQDLGDF
jgi:hypothetical protein